MDALGAIGQFIAKAGWPIVALIAIVLFRGPLSRLQSFSWGDKLKFQIGQKLDQAARGAPAERPPPDQIGPSTEEVARAGQVEGLAAKLDLTDLRNAAVDLAFEYERIRASMPSGDPRTRRLEVVVAKMRALGRAIIPLRDEFKNSMIAGQRLVAVASFQVAPDYEALGWLAQRIRSEKPFVGYHAAAALLVAARDPRASSQIGELREVRAQLKEVEGTLLPDTDRAGAIKEFDSIVAQLGAQRAATA